MPCLIIVSGPHEGQLFKLDSDENLIGRGDDCGIQFVDEKASRNHCRISRASGETLEGSGIKVNKWILEDLGSSNGTNVNGQPADGPVTLDDGLMIGIGTTQGVFLRDTFDTAEEAREYADNLGGVEGVDADDSWPLDPPWKSQTLSEG